MDFERIISENVRRLMAMRGWRRPGELAQAAKISYRMASYVINRGRTPSIEYLHKIAKAFDVSVQQLITPDLPDDVLASVEFRELLANYAKATPDGRELINLQARREAELGGGDTEARKRPFDLKRPVQ